MDEKEEKDLNCQRKINIIYRVIFFCKVVFLEVKVKKGYNVDKNVSWETYINSRVNSVTYTLRTVKYNFNKTLDKTLSTAIWY